MNYKIRNAPNNSDVNNNSNSSELSNQTFGHSGQAKSASGYQSTKKHFQPCHGTGQDHNSNTPTPSINIIIIQKCKKIKINLSRIEG